MRVRVPVVMMLLITAAPAAFGVGLTVAPFFHAADGTGLIPAIAVATALGGSCGLVAQDVVRRLRRRAFRQRMLARLNTI